MKPFDRETLGAHSRRVIDRYPVLLTLPLLAIVFCTGADSDSSPKSEEKVPMASSGVIEKFKIPERDINGDLVWLIQGEKAKIVEEGKIRIFNVQLDTYRKGQIDQTLESSQCMLIRQTVDGKVSTHAESTNDVKIVGKNIEITADGFKWFPGQTRLLMEKNVQVTFARKKGTAFKES